MSITPYNNLTVRDLNGNQQSYVNSTTEVGYFSGTYSGTIPKGTVFSLPAFLKTNNGVATVDPSGSFGLTLNAGVYKINLSLFPTSTQDGSSNISFNFGTRQMLYDPSNNLVNAFGGVCPTGMFTYDPSNNPYSPGIISWVADGYSSGNSISNFQQNPYTYELAYKYNNAGYPNKKLYSGISTTEMTFVLDSSANIFFNAYNNSNADITMGNCCFTLKLMSTPFTVPVRTWRWSQTSLANKIWGGIASSSSGQYLVAVEYGGVIQISSDYGANWSSRSGISIGLPSGTTVFWSGVTSDVTGQYLAASINGGYIYVSSNYGVTWLAKNATDPGSRSWYTVNSSSNGKYLFASGGSASIYTSSDYGNNWQLASNIINNSSFLVSNTGKNVITTVDDTTTTTKVSRDYGITWNYTGNSGYNRNVAGSTDTKYAYIANGSGNIFISSNYGIDWLTIGFPYSLGWVTSSINGQYVAFASETAGGGINTSSNYGLTWTKQTSAILPTTPWRRIASSSNGFRLVAGNATGTTTVGGLYIGVYS